MASLSTQQTLQATHTTLLQDAQGDFDRFTVLQEAPESDLSAKTYFAEELVPFDGNPAAVTSAVHEIIGVRDGQNHPLYIARIEHDPSIISMGLFSPKTSLASDAAHSSSNMVLQGDALRIAPGAAPSSITADNVISITPASYARVHIPFGETGTPAELPGGGGNSGGTDPGDGNTGGGDHGGETGGGNTGGGNNGGGETGGGNHHGGNNNGGNNGGGNTGGGNNAGGNEPCEPGTDSGSNPIIDLDLGLNLLGDPGQPLIDLDLGLDLSGDTLLDLDTTIDTILDTGLDLSATIDDLSSGIELVADITTGLTDTLHDGGAAVASIGEGLTQTLGDTLTGVTDLVAGLLSPQDACDNGNDSAIITVETPANLLENPLSLLTDTNIAIDLTGNSLLDIDAVGGTVAHTVTGLQDLVNNLVSPDAPCDDGNTNAIITLNLDTADLSNPTELLGGLLSINPNGNTLLDANLGIATMAGTVIDLQAETTSLTDGLLDLSADAPIVNTIGDLLGGLLTSPDAPCEPDQNGGLTTIADGAISNVQTLLDDTSSLTAGLSDTVGSVLDSSTGLLGNLLAPQDPCEDGDSSSGNGAIIDLQLDANLLAHPGDLLDGALNIDLSGDSLLNLDVGVDTLLDTTLDLDATLDTVGLNTLNLDAVLDTGLFGGGGDSGTSPAPITEAWTNHVESTVTQTVQTVTQTINTVLPVIPVAVIPEVILPKIKPFKLF